MFFQHIEMINPFKFSSVHIITLMDFKSNIFIYLYKYTKPLTARKHFIRKFFSFVDFSFIFYLFLPNHLFQCFISLLLLKKYFTDFPLFIFFHISNSLNLKLERSIYTLYI